MRFRHKETGATGRTVGGKRVTVVWDDEHNTVGRFTPDEFAQECVEIKTCSWTDDTGQCGMEDGHEGDHLPVPSGARPDDEDEGAVLYNNVNVPEWATVMDLRMAIESGHFNPRSQVKVQARHNEPMRSVRAIKVVDGNLVIVGY